MSCESIRVDLMEAARASLPLPSALAGHLENCGECASYHRAQAALTQQLRALPAAEPPAALEGQIWGASRGIGSTIGAGWRAGAMVALAATLAVGIAIVPRRTAPPDAAQEPFVAVPYTVPLAPYERAEVRHMEVPVTALLSAGFQLPLQQAGGTVPADVLVGQDGRIHAIRFSHN